jgi:hypothetical protein
MNLLPHARRLAAPATALSAATALALAAALPASGHTRRAVASSATVFTSHVFATGEDITQVSPNSSTPITQPDDITQMGGHIYVAFQNGVGPQGQAASNGNKESTVVEFSGTGHEIGQWDILGKCDGMTADPALGALVATVNEDAHSSLYLIKPGSGPVHYRYNEPLPSKGGTDAISVYKGLVLISASAPGTTGKAAPEPYYPALYKATFNSATKVATVKPMFYDEASATVANTGATAGKTVKLGLTDPDSNEVVPAFAPRFAGDFMLTSQGDEEQIFMSGTDPGKLQVLKLTHSVDDTAWPSSASGTLYAVDNSADKIYAITGPFKRGQVIAAKTPCDQNGAPGTCPVPAKGYPPNSLVQINESTGVLTPLPLSGPTPHPQGLLFMP